MDKLIELIDIRKVYGEEIKTEALKKINLKIDKGEFCSIIGPSGSGKSTLLNILGTLDKSSSGIYNFNGFDIQNFTKKEFADFRNREIGFVFQFHHLLPEFTLIENVLMPFRIKKRNITNEILKEAERNLELVGILNRKDYNATNLSGGEKQRGAIARALMNKPNLVLADEPTGNLDSEATEKIYSLLRDINKEYRTTFIIVTHDRHLAAKSDRIIEILDGNINRDIIVDKDNNLNTFNQVRPCNCYLANKES